METLATSSNFLCLWHILFFFLSLVLLVYISSPSIPHPLHSFYQFYFILYIFSSSPLLLVCLSQADFSVALKKPYQFLVQFSFLSLILLPLFAVSPVSFFFFFVFQLLLAYVSLLKFDDYENWFSFAKSTCEWTLKRMPSLMEITFFFFWYRLCGMEWIILIF